MKTLYALMAVVAILTGFCGCGHTGTRSGPSTIYTLEVPQAELLLRLSDHSPDPLFNKALLRAQDTSIRSKGDFLTHFGEAYAAVAPQERLADIFAYVPRFHKTVTLQSTNEQVLATLRKYIQDEMVMSKNLITSRIATDDISVNADIAMDRPLIRVEVWDDKHPEQTQTLLTTGGRLEFWDTYDNLEIYESLSKADQKLNEILAAEPSVSAGDQDSTDVAADLIGDDPKAKAQLAATRKAKKDSAGMNPLFRLLNPATEGSTSLASGPVIGYALGRDTAKVNRYLSKDAVRKILPSDIRLMWSYAPVATDRDIYALFAIRMPLGKRIAPIDGSSVTDVNAGTGGSGSFWGRLFNNYTGQSAHPRQGYTLNIRLDKPASLIWEQMTDKALHGQVNGSPAQRSVAVVIDGAVYSAPRVVGKIKGGNTEITGITSAEQATNMEALIRGGGLPVPLRIVSVSTGPAAKP